MLFVSDPKLYRGSLGQAVPPAVVLLAGRPLIAADMASMAAGRPVVMMGRAGGGAEVAAEVVPSEEYVTPCPQAPTTRP
ncbi:hypothetical protein AB0903_10255 [Streptomyces sp. NPDC048389]|uniref:hypothetical protein n=1 Tax=Streptomyces sp. NPDC048389 TaxID=3154622 RepID=UPI0034521372